MLSVTVSQCQVRMRDDNPTSKQGPDDEPLDNRTLNSLHQANTALFSHTHAHTRTCMYTHKTHKSACTANWLDTLTTGKEQMTDRGFVSMAGLPQPYGRGLKFIKVSRTPSFKAGKTRTL